MQKIIDKGFNIIDKAESKLSASVSDVEDRLFKEVMALFKTVDISAGRLQTSEKAEQFLMTLDKKLQAILNNSKYKSAVEEFITNFDAISRNTIELQSAVNNVNILKSQLNPFQRVATSETINNLLGAGVDRSFIQPIRQSLYRSILLGSTVSEAENNIRNYLISTKDKDSNLLRYVKQVATDSMQQYQGLIEANTAVELGFNAFNYVGSIIKDSRAQCAKWADQDIIKFDEEFKAELKAATNGTLTYNVRGKIKKASGMIPGTTDYATFLINRGGYNCRHRAISTKLF